MEGSIVDQRKAQRYSSKAGICINGFEGEALLKDISSTGFCLESATSIIIEINGQYKVKVTPESKLGIKPFEVLVSVQWVRNSEDSFEMGLRIVKGPMGQAFKQYMEAINATTAPSGGFQISRLLS